MQSLRQFGLLLAMDMRELLASRAYWLMLLAIAALLGQTSHAAIELYAEASGAGGGPAALAQGLSPLEGFLVPAFGAYDLAATLLFPFVVIRLIAEERQNGAVWLQMQWPVSFGETMASKGIALLLGWIIALLPGVSALLVWSGIGGHLSAPETLGLLLGYLLRGITAIGVCAAAVAISSSAASAAVVALAFTIGTWALDYFAAARGGVLAVIANYTPWAALRSFERGEIRIATMGILCVIGITGLALASTAARSGRNNLQRTLRSMVAIVVATVTCSAIAQLRFSYDVSENRRNSFPGADAALLASIDEPLHVRAYLAAEDPRLVDMEHGVFAKLRRTMKHITIEYTSSGRSGLFEDSKYGEIQYEMGGRQMMSRSSIEEVVLETVYAVAGRKPPPPSNDEPYPGYPLLKANNPDSHAGAWLFFAAWPVLIAGAWLSSRPKRVPRSG